MVSATEARVISDKAKFAASGFAALAESTIKEAAAKGEDEASMLIPLNVVADMVRFLNDNGYEEIVITGTITGALVSVAW